MRYDYSIEVARAIYSHIADDAEACLVCCQAIENYFSSRGWSYEKTEKSGYGLDDIVYKSKEQTVTFQSSGGKPAQILLYQYEPGTAAIIGEAFVEKAIFGLPVFTMTIMEDSPLAMLSLMSKSTYVSLDTPEEQMFRHRMNALDDIIAKYGDGSDDW